MSKPLYYTTAAAAMLFAAGLLVLQIVGGLEYTHGASLYTQASMVTAMIAVAALPLFIHAAWGLNKAIALVLFVGFTALLAYSMPASIGRIGEVREVKALAADDAAELKARLASIGQTLGYAEPDALRECAGAPDPLPRGKWQECRRKRASVDALLNERSRLTAELGKRGSERVGDLASENVAWALSHVGVSAASIRKGSGMAFAIGLEVAIFGLVWLAASLVGKARRSTPQPAVATSVASESVAAEPRRDGPRPEPSPPTGGVMTKIEAERDLLMLLRIGQDIPSQDWLAQRWRVGKSAVSKWVDQWEAAGVVRREQVGHYKMIVAA